jgi:hypothetical protein
MAEIDSKVEQKKKKKKRKSERPRIKRHQNIVRITVVAQILYVYLWFSEQYDQSLQGKKLRRVKHLGLLPLASPLHLSLLTYFLSSSAHCFFLFSHTLLLVKGDKQSQQTSK